MKRITDRTHVLFLAKCGTPLLYRYNDRATYADDWDPWEHPTPPSKHHLKVFDFAVPDETETG